MKQINIVSLINIRAMCIKKLSDVLFANYKLNFFLQILPAVPQFWAFVFSDGFFNFAAMYRFLVPLFLQHCAESATYTFLLVCLDISNRLQHLNQELATLRGHIINMRECDFQLKIRKLKLGFCGLTEAQRETQAFFSVFLLLTLFQQFVFVLMLGVLMYTVRAVASMAIYGGVLFLASLAVIQFYLVVLGPEKVKFQVQRCFCYLK